jgi:hypothetical protein
MPFTYGHFLARGELFSFRQRTDMPDHIDFFRNAARSPSSFKVVYYNNGRSTVAATTTTTTTTDHRTDGGSTDDVLDRY